MCVEAKIVFASMVEPSALSTAQKLVFESTTYNNLDTLPPPYTLKRDGPM